MELILSKEKLEKILEEMRDASRKEFLLFAADGTFLAGTVKQPGIETLVANFVSSMAEMQIIQEWIYFRVELDGETAFVLLCSEGTETDQAYIIGKMAACQIRNLYLAAQNPENQLQGLREIINGEIIGEKIAEKCHQLRIKTGTYAVYVIQYKDDSDSVLLETLKNLFVNAQVDYMVEMDGTRTVLMKNIADIPGENYEQYAHMIVDNMQAEAMQNVWVGYGDPVSSFEQVHHAYKNACTSLKIGMIYYGTERAFYYEQLGIGRLIYKLPVDLCEMFLKEVLGDNVDIDFDEETMLTINKLFENNLNISETARQLYVHRNTLVYRLERIERRLGLDIRSFEDAMLFKIAMMVKIHLQEFNVVK